MKTITNKQLEAMIAASDVLQPGSHVWFAFRFLARSMHSADKIKMAPYLNLFTDHLESIVNRTDMKAITKKQLEAILDASDVLQPVSDHWYALRFLAFAMASTDKRERDRYLDDFVYYMEFIVKGDQDAEFAKYLESYLLEGDQNA